MLIKPIKSEADHAAALREIERLWGADEGTAGGDRLEVLTTLVEAYEQAHFPIARPIPSRRSSSAWSSGARIRRR
jgi:HTH-type transcriptional regulator / antitoxin HigA